ncbi:ABC transporter substrate-binding protein [Anaerocolumna xylanovorans]|uniref:NitT/TauT family transport system substrate-binding protein n=1 Tax=Anaerocolumna xylanovorans DSM 12503 TaxID=1121345 RepID=A0A1M7YFL5_9FIRM|nr:ABC transporter substrate-binding protein [Anaerocolumna xylanovorans]SHO51435.1 NitT/TauT family transport system substrate-binding protein [Anaerocolumna xylanovorans DSM 12503]
MKRKGIAVLAILLLVAVFLPGCSKGDGNLTKVQLNEVAHSMFYAPQYAAIELGYFKDEGLDVKLVNGLGADKTMTAVLSGDADIGFMGPEATIYVYNEGKEDYVVNFAQLTQRAGNFLVTRDKNEDFTWDNIKGKTVIGGRAGGMPEMVFEYILKKNGIDPKTDLNLVQNIDFGLTAQAFAAGNGDYTIEFEPAATALEKEGTGKVAASLGVESGKVPYTVYSAKKSYIDKHPEVIQKFTNAIQKGLDYVNSHKPEEIAKTIQPQFKETDPDTLTAIVKRYYDQQTWKENTVLKEDNFTLLQDILEDGGVISTRAPYDKLVTTVYAEKAK